MVKPEKAKKFVVLEEGETYYGEITQCEFATPNDKNGKSFEVYEYTIRVDGQPFDNRVSYGTGMSFDEEGSAVSKLAKLAVRFGYKYDAENPKEWSEQSIVGLRCKFVAGAPNKVKGKDGEPKVFSTILKDTVGPEKKQPKLEG